MSPLYTNETINIYLNFNPDLFEFLYEQFGRDVALSQSNTRKNDG